MRAPQTSAFAAQLAAHAHLRPVPLQAMYAAHPAQVDQAGRRFVPAVHHGPRGPSIFLYPFSRFAYRDRVLPDGRTIEYHPSTNARTTAELRALVGQEVTLYAQVAGREAREARVVVQHPAGLPDDVFHLRIVAPAAAPPAAKPAVKRVMWADME